MQNPFPIKGSSCHDIKPQVRKLVRTIEGKLKLCFDRQHILDMNVGITVDGDSRPEEALMSGLHKCKRCLESI